MSYHISPRDSSWNISQGVQLEKNQKNLESFKIGEILERAVNLEKDASHKIKIVLGGGKNNVTLRKENSICSDFAPILPFSCLFLQVQ